MSATAAMPAMPEMERVVLPVRPGVEPCGKAPVRIFLGTEAAQQRAERVFVWSIEKVRDPARVYEITLMRDLPGFDRRGWTTSFTNYRFAVPELAGATGRAIYNDEDQIYLRDPGDLFDADLGDHGYLAVSERDTSVMLLDCARMARVWTLDAARSLRKRALLDRACTVRGLYGELDPGWNARDEEYVEGRSHLLHYTTLHTQPWRPFPERFVYHPNPLGNLWFDLEREANAAGFQVYTREDPSPAFRRVRAGAIVSAAPGGRGSDADVRRLVERSGARSLLELALDGSPAQTVDAGRWGCDSVERVGLLHAMRGNPGDHRADGVVCQSGLDALPSQDAPWVVDELFRHARHFVFASVRVRPPSRRRGEPPAGTVGTPDGWQSLFWQAAARHPEVHWELAIQGDPDFPGPAPSFRSGGRFLGSEPPRVWVLTDGRPGHTTQSIGLAEELGWPYERIDLQFNRLAELPNALLGPRVVGLRGGAQGLQPPWPDLVIACGRRTAPVTRWIRARARGRTRVVQLGRKGTHPPDAFDLTVAPAYARLFPNPARIVTTAPLTQVRRPALEEASLRWKSLIEPAPGPRIALLVGGDSQRHAFPPEVATRLGQDVMAMARELGGSIFATTSRRTSPEAAEALAAALEGAHHVHVWRPDQSPDENPYLAYLALSDLLVVSGESASMLAEACATGKPVFIYPLPDRPKSAKLALADAVVDTVTARAYARPTNRRGTTRPQKRLEHLCSNWLSRGVIRPAPDVAMLHRSLIESGVARAFGDPGVPPSSHSETARVADRVRALLGVPAEED